MDVMKIGFFGDSYVDVNREYQWSDIPQQRIWAISLYFELNATCVASGKGGTNQFYAIKTWQDYLTNNDAPDVAIFTFTWHHRLYNKRVEWQEALSFITEGKNPNVNLRHQVREMTQAVDLYTKHLYDEDQALFNHEQAIRWILELPEKHIRTKFIFIPNTEVSREFAKKHFKNGVLLDFALGTISEMEGENVNAIPMIPSKNSKFAHLTYKNHVKIKDILVEIVNNYSKFNGNLYTKEYNYFEE